MPVLSVHRAYWEDKHETGRQRWLLCPARICPGYGVVKILVMSCHNPYYIDYDKIGVTSIQNLTPTKIINK